MTDCIYTNNPSVDP